MSQNSNRQTLNRPRRILFVCSGNTCRSPMAEAIARDVARRRGLDRLEFRSAGTSASPGSTASQGALDATLRNGLNLEAHRSSMLSRDLVEWADLILTMGPAHLLRVLELGGEGKSHLLGGFASGPESQDGGPAVPDPFGGDREVYEGTFQILDDYVKRSLRRLEKGEKGGS